MKKKLIALLFLTSMLISTVAFAIYASGDTTKSAVASASDIPLVLWYDEEAPKDNENSPTASATEGGEDFGWERWSLPIGNGYFGASIFGRTDTERVQITEKTLQNPASISKGGVSYSVGGLNNFSETYIDFGHKNSGVSNYIRYLDIETAISGVEYTYGGVKYTREYFTSYPDKALVIRLDADKDGALSFTLRPTIPYEQSYAAFPNDGVTKSGSVASEVRNGVGYIELSGKLGYYDVDFLGLYKVYTDGGTVSASTVNHTYKDTDGTSITDIDGTIKVSGATSAYIVVTLGTDYELSSDVFTSSNSDKPTEYTDLLDTRAKVSGYMSAIDKKIEGMNFDNAYKTLKDAHVADHCELFGRVSLDLGCNSADFDLTTDALLSKYQKGTSSAYLETLLFQYGRYLLIASSREGALPANLQGAWNTYNIPPWGCDYTHNINVQMNYWPAFSTNLAETFISYMDYNKAYMQNAEANADAIINNYHSSLSGKDGGNGWVMAAHTNVFNVPGERSAGHLGFTTQLFWEYYSYTKDPAVLNYVYDILVNAARYITKCVELDENGNYLVSHCDSPEMFVDGIWYYTVGTTYAQSFAYINNYNALSAAKELGIDLSDEKLLSSEEYSILNTIMEQIDKYDPITVGLSGQIKEFRDEDYYGSIGDEYHHRHTSQLVGLYPGNIINSTTPAWLDAAMVTLNERGDSGTGWGVAFKLNLWARTKNGERTYDLLRALIADNTATNLWNLHSPFQIDGNFGATAGISEMLLQSHEGYIAPLAAIPDKWQSGSYQGLVARGNFEVSAAWSNGIATELRILSKNGEEASVFYPSIGSSHVVRASDGKAVSFTKDGNDLITFDTTEGETYIITNFKKIDSPDTPTGFSCDRNENGTYSLTWTTSSDATGYNVYVAIENAPDYTFVGTARSGSFTYTPTDEDARITFALTAVNKSGAESSRALCYTNTDVITDYGIIPGEAAGYPYALFIKSESESEYLYCDSFDGFLAAINKAKTLLYAKNGAYKGGTAVIYVTDDVKATGDSFNNASQIDGTVIVDLGGHSILCGVNRLIGFEAKATEGLIDHNTKIEIKNGTLYTITKPIAEIFSGSGFNYTGTKTFEILFENVTFKHAKTESSGVSILKSRGSFNQSKRATLSAEFVDCTFDYEDQISALTLIDCSAGGEFVNCDVSIAGGVIKTKSLSTLTVFCGSVNDNFAYTLNDSGKGTEFILDEEAPLITEYGLIPADIAKMRFVLLHDGNVIYSYNTYYDAIHRAKVLLSGESGALQGECIAIYMTSDYTHTDNIYNNFAQIDGTLIIDLGGNTITQEKNYMFDLVGKGVSSGNYIPETTVEIKNGTILTSDKPIMRITAPDGSGNFKYNGTKSYNFTYSNVTFDKTDSAVAYNPIAKVDSYVDNNNGNKKMAFSAIFDNCTFISSDAVLFDFSLSNLLNAKITISGGSIITDDLNSLEVLLPSDQNDTLDFAKSEDDSYTLLKMPKDADAPTSSFNSGTLKFLRTEYIGNDSVWILFSSVAVDTYVAKMSISLEESFVLNVYIPKSYTKSFTFNNKRYSESDLCDLEVITIDGLEYYFLKANLPSNKALTEIPLKASITCDGESASCSFTFSLIKYAKEVIKNKGEADIRLVCDALSYVRAAYLYFCPDNTDAIYMVDAVIGEEYDANNPVITGDNTSVPKVGLCGASFDLEARQSVKLYLSSGYSASRFEFYINGNKLEKRTGRDKNGTYIELVLPPYLMCERIDYTVDGSNEGSYCIDSYIAFAEGENNYALQNLVQRYLKYCTSAKEYLNTAN